MYKFTIYLYNIFYGISYIVTTPHSLFEKELLHLTIPQIYLFEAFHWFPYIASPFIAMIMRKYPKPGYWLGISSMGISICNLAFASHYALNPYFYIFNIFANHICFELGKVCIDKISLYYGEIENAWAVGLAAEIATVSIASYWFGKIPVQHFFIMAAISCILCVMVAVYFIFENPMEWIDEISNHGFRLSEMFKLPRNFMLFILFIAIYELAPHASYGAFYMYSDEVDKMYLGYGSISGKLIGLTAISYIIWSDMQWKMSKKGMVVICCVLNAISGMIDFYVSLNKSDKTTVTVLLLLSYTFSSAGSQIAEFILVSIAAGLVDVSHVHYEIAMSWWNLICFLSKYTNAAVACLFGTQMHVTVSYMFTCAICSIIPTLFIGLVSEDPVYISI